MRPWRGTTGGAHAAERAPVVQLRVLLLAVALVSVVVGSLVTLRQSVAAPSTVGAAMVHSTGVAADRLGELDKLVVYGHSIPSGVGASRVSRGYAVLAAEATGLQLVSHAYGGSGSARAARIMRSAPPAGPEDVVVIHTGLNELFKRGERAVSVGRVSIRRMLAWTTEAARRVLVLECQPSTWAATPAARDLQDEYGAWNAMLRELAGAWRDVDVLDTCERWDAEKYTDESHYHPNDAGHALLARDLVALL